MHRSCTAFILSLLTLYGWVGKPHVLFKACTGMYWYIPSCTNVEISYWPVPCCTNIFWYELACTILPDPVQGYRILDVYIPCLSHAIDRHCMYMFIIFQICTDMCVPNSKFANMSVPRKDMGCVNTSIRSTDMVYTCLYTYTHLAIYIHVHTMYRHVYIVYGRFFLDLCMYVILCRGVVHATYKYRHFIQFTNCFDQCTYTYIICSFLFFVLPCWLTDLQVGTGWC